MDINGSRTLAAPRERVYAALNDPVVLKACIPGCETLERVSDDQWSAVVATRIGPVSARFNSKIRLADLAPPSGYTLHFEGQGAAAGFAKGEARVSLAELEPDRTQLTYNAKAQVGGKIAQVGSRLIDGAAAKLTEEFFTRFAQQVEPPVPATAAADSAVVTTPAEAEQGGQGWVRYAALIAIAILLVVLYMRGGFR